jgi:hypothetical protein
MFLRFLITSMLLLLSGAAVAYEQPKYDLLEKSEVFELRAYKPIIVAEDRTSRLI